MSTSSQQSQSNASPPPPPLRWRSWPLRDAPLHTLWVAIGLAAAAFVTGWFSGQIALAVLALVALTAAMWRFFLPVVFELGSEGVDQWLFGRQRHIPWQGVRRYEICSAGVLLLPDEDRTAMAPLRGLYLPWTTHRDEVLAHVRHHLDRPSEA